MNKPLHEIITIILFALVIILSASAIAGINDTNSTDNQTDDQTSVIDAATDPTINTTIDGSIEEPLEGSSEEIPASKSSDDGSYGTLANKAIYGYVNSSTPNVTIENATVKVWITVNCTNATNISYCDCYTDSVLTANDGTYTAELNTLTYAGSQGSACDTCMASGCENEWKRSTIAQTETNELWAEVNGSSGYPAHLSGNTTRSNMQCYGDPNCGGSQQLNDIVLDELDQPAPNVTLIAPPNATINTTWRTIYFYFNVSAYFNIVNCSLVLDDAINKTKTGIDKTVVNNISQTFADGNYTWSINCTDERSKTGASETRNLEVLVPNFVPYFIVNTTDRSNSTSPTTVGNLINFSAIANDTDGNSYQLVVCNTSLISQSGICSSGLICNSSFVAPETQASCYHNTSGDSNPAYNWYSFVCDGINCSAAENSSSPYEVNHHPRYTTLPAITIAEDSNQSINLSSYFSDIDGDNLGFTAPSIANISIIINNATGTAVLTPAQNWYGIRYINFTAIDEHGLTNTSNTFIFNVTPVNDAPTITGLPDKNVSEDTAPPANWVDLWNYSSDIETAASALTYTIFSQTNASLINCSVVSNRYLNCSRPAQDQHGFSDITIIVNDESLNATDTLRITVLPVNDPPYLNSSRLVPNVTIQEDSYNDTINLLNHFYEVDGSDLNFTFSPVTNLTIIINNITGTVNITPDANFFGTRNVVFYATDGSFVTPSNNITIIVVNVNDPPVMLLLPNVSTQEDVTPPANWVDLHNYSYDIDNTYAQLNYTLLSNTNASLINCSIVQNRYVNCSTPAHDQYGKIYLNISITDGEYADSRVMNITVISVNDPPSQPDLLAPPPDYASNETRPYFNLSDSVDPEGDNLTYYIQISNSTGFETLQVNQSLNESEYTLSEAQALPDGYWYWRAVVCDSNEACVYGTIQYLKITTDTHGPVIIIIEPDPGEMLGWTVPIYSTINDWLVNVSSAWYEITNESYDVVSEGVLYQNSTPPWSLYWNSQNATGFGSSSMGGSSIGSSSEEPDSEQFGASAGSGEETEYSAQEAIVRNFTYTVWANDTLGNIAWTAVNFSINQQIPSVNIIYPKSHNISSDFTVEIRIQSEVLVFAWFNITNSSGSFFYGNFSNNIEDDNQTINYADFINISGWPSGVYNVTAYGEDNSTINRTETTYFILDVDPPYYSNISRSPSIVYNDDYVRLNVTWLDNNIVQTVIIAHNASGTWTNYTASRAGDVYYITIPASMLENQESVAWNSSAMDNFGNWNLDMPTQVFNVSNRPPYLNTSYPVQNITIAEDTSTIFNISLNFYDMDLDDLNYTVIGAANVTISINNNTGIVNITPDPNFNGILYVVFYATDGIVVNATPSNNVTINITAVNDPPIVNFTGLTISLLEDGYNDSTDLSDYVSDLDNTDEEINWSCSTNETDVTAIASNITKMLNITGSNDFFGNVNVTCIAIDLEGGNDTSSFITIIESVNDPPIINFTGFNITLDEDSYNASTNLSTYVTDVDTLKENINWTCVSNESDVTALADNVTKILNITATNNFFGAVNITCTAFDPEGADDSDSFIADVASVNDPPIVDFASYVAYLQQNGYNDSTNLSNHVTDIDTSISDINWTCVSNETSVSVYPDNVSKILNITSSNNFYGNATINCTGYNPDGSSDYSTFIAVVILSRVDYPPYLNIRRLEENISSPNWTTLRHVPVLNWSAVPGAEGYNVYYSESVYSIEQINISNLSSDIFVYSNITILNLTDFNASENLLRFYRVSAFAASAENVSPIILGKQTFVFKGLGGTGNSYHRQNWLGFVLNTSLYAESFLDEIGSAAIRIKELDKTNATVYSVVTHNKDTASNNFSLEPGLMYTVETGSDDNHTITGYAVLDAPEWQMYGLGGTGNSYHRQNWASISYTTLDYYAESLLDEIGSAAIRIKELDKTNATVYSVVTHNKDTASNNFSIVPGTGYVIETGADVNFTPQD